MFAPEDAASNEYAAMAVAKRDKMALSERMESHHPKGIETAYAPELSHSSQRTT